MIRDMVCSFGQILGRCKTLTVIQKDETKYLEYVQSQLARLETSSKLNTTRWDIKLAVHVPPMFKDLWKLCKYVHIVNIRNNIIGGRWVTRICAGDIMRFMRI